MCNAKNKLLENYSLKQFSEACKRIPRPIACAADGVYCPWCGQVHRTITFGKNECDDCQRLFWFGYPGWWDRKDPCSFVPFPHREWEACGKKAELLPHFNPTQILQEIYFRDAEEHLGVYADMDNPQ